MEETLFVARMSDLSEGTVHAACVEGVELVVLKSGGALAVFQGECPHQGTLLGGGTIQDGTLICSGHGWRFNCDSGERIDESRICLKRFTHCIDGDQIMVRRAEVLQWKTAQHRPSPAPSSDRSKHLPGPKGLPILGNLLQLDLKRLHLILEEWANTFGSIYEFKVGRRRAVAISDADLINDILRKRPQTYRRLRTIESVLKEMGANGVFSTEGELWRRQRRVAMHALNTDHLRQFFKTLVTVTERLKNRWSKIASNGRTVKARDDLMRYTVDVTTSLAFGYDMNTLEKDGDIIQQHLEAVFPMINRRINAPFPYWRFIRLPADRALDRALAAIRQTVAGFISHCRARLAEEPERASSPTNFLEAMLVARDEDDSAFTEEEILGNLLTMLLAGEDTTAHSMSWILYFMMDHPDVQMEMQREADEVLGDSMMLFEFRDHERLVYTEAVAFEAMRLKSVAPVIFLEALHDVQLGGVRILKGTSLYLLTRQCGLQESEFAAAREFRPERWLTSTAGSTTSRNSKAFLPFGAGPRFCPGRNLALLEIKAVMAMLCRNFYVSRPKGHPPVDEEFAFAMMPTELNVKFDARQ